MALGTGLRIALPHWFFRKKEDQSISKIPAGQRYLFAVACVLAAFLLRYGLDPYLQEEIPYAFFSPAAMLAAWYGGFMPGCLALFLGTFLGYVFFVPPQGAFGAIKAFEATRLASAAVPAFISIWIIELLHRARNRADFARAREKKHAQQLETEVRHRERAEAELRFSHQLIIDIGEAQNLRKALGIVLHRICEFTGWSLGHAWLPSWDKMQLELCPEICTCHAGMQKFKDASEKIAFMPGVGILGRVWQSKKPLWIRDVRAAPDFLRARAAEEDGIKSALFFPIVANDEVVALLEFFHLEIRERDEAFVHLVSTVATQLGNLMKRKQAEDRLLDSERRLREAQSIARIGNWEWNVEKNELLWSDELYHLFGVAQETFTKTYTDFLNRVHPEDRDCVLSIIQKALQDGEPFEFGHRVLRADGPPRFLYCYGTAVRNKAGDIVKLFGTAQDITEQKEVELALDDARKRLQEYASSLEKKVSERTADLEKSLQQMEGLLYTIAHDLRAPLRAMGGFTHIIMEEYGSVMDDKAKDYATRVVNASRQMDDLIQDLLNYGRLASAEFPKERVLVEDVVNRLLNEFEHEIKIKNARVEIERPLPILWSNATVVEEIFSNLLSNALKFVHKGVPPRIRIYALDRNDFSRICVKDNGIGIPQEFQGKIFKVFERLHRSEEYEGTGIGLAVVSKAVERLGGQAGVESEPEKGSCFWIELPKEKDGEAQSNDASMSRGDKAEAANRL